MATPKDPADSAVAAVSVSSDGSVGDRRCPACGSPARESWDWCVQCGTALSADAAIRLQEVPDEQSPTSAGEVVTEVVAETVAGVVIGSIIDGVLDKL
jgi:hypothetical protein